VRLGWLRRPSRAVTVGTRAPRTVGARPGVKAQHEFSPLAGSTQRVMGHAQDSAGGPSTALCSLVAVGFGSWPIV
jgi:hypothetical protein